MNEAHERNTTAFGMGNVGWLLSLGVLAGSVTALAQPPQQPRDQLSEPVYRVSKADVDPNATARQHPLDPALALARDGLREHPVRTSATTSA